MYMHISTLPGQAVAAGLTYHVVNRVVTRRTKRHLGVSTHPSQAAPPYGRQRVDLGVDIRIIVEALGHESLESTQIGTQVSFQRTRKIGELFCSPRSRSIRSKTVSKLSWFQPVYISRSSCARRVRS